MADAIQTTQQIVLSVRMKGDAGPQTGDVVLGGASYQDFSPTMGYDKNEVIVYEGALYRAKETMDPQTWDPNNWEALTDVTVRLKDFEVFTPYKQFEIVKYNESLYRAKYDFTSDDAFDVRDWDGIDTVDVDIQDFQARNTYDKYETIAHDGKLWRAKESFTSINTFNPNDWELLTDLKVLEFQPNTDYQQNNIVTVAGVLYRALADFTSSSTFDPDDWERLNVTGTSDFLPNNFYIKGSMISRDGKLYLAKQDFTSGATFDIADWEIQNDIAVGDFLTNEFYPENHIVQYEGTLYRAKAEFTSGGSFDPDDWEEVNPSKVLEFTPDKHYYKGEPIFMDGNLYIAKNTFTAGATFDPTQWQELSLHTLQMVYENSSNNFAGITNVRPVTGTVFEEKIFVPGGGDSHLYTFTDNSAGDVVKVQATNADGGYSRIISEKTSSTVENEIFEAKVQDSILKVGVRRNGGYPYSFLNMKDNNNEEFLMEVNDVNSYVSFTPNIQKAFTDALCRAKKNQLGVVRTDGVTTRTDEDADDGILSAYPVFRAFASNTKYYAGEGCLYRGEVYVAKGDFTSGDSFDIADWQVIKANTETYAVGNPYSVGDVIRDENNYLYYCNTAMSSAPATRNNAHWTPIKIKAENVVLNTSGLLVATNTNLQESIKLIDKLTYYAVQPYDDSTRYLFTTAPKGSAAPASVAGKTVICIWTE